MLNAEFVGADTLTEQGFENTPLAISDGLIVAQSLPRQVDVTGFKLLPGLVDVHGDGFERHVAPRRGAMKDIAAGIGAAEAEMAANGITTGVLAQFISWEGGLRGEAFGDKVLCAIRDADSVTDLRAQLRFETHLLDLYADLPRRLRDWDVDYVVFNDHLPHDRLAQGRVPKRLVAQALKAARSPEAHHALMQSLHARTKEVPAALDTLCAHLRVQGIQMGSHDDDTVDARQIWSGRGVHIAEFPETLDAIEGPGQVVLGAPNVVRGGSHNGNVSALDVVLMGACDALASDYHYPSLRRAAVFLAQTLGWSAAWKLVSAGPAHVLGLTDRGALRPGLRADVLILDDMHRVAGTISGGRVSYLTGDLAERFLR
ncbi:MAG: alpha-D-ribose 1-methylphosphonate 5-triphosphate diphosphatase [Paracoccaceae bacterium]